MSQTAATAPDVQQLGQQGLSEAAFPGGRNQPFRVYLKPEAHEGLWKHANEHGSVEICGVLVGKWARDADGPFLLVSDFIRGEAATSKFAEVTFTHDTWAKINHEMDTRFADLSIVGWYHSHPDFGIFLSDRDRFIQEHFFSGPGQVALVVDPVRKTEGVFIWKQGKPALAPHYWVGDRVQGSTAAGQESNGQPPGPAASAAPTGQAPGGPAGEADWLNTTTSVLFCVLLFLTGFMISGCYDRNMLLQVQALDNQERLRIRQGERAWALSHLNLRPGLADVLDTTHKELEEAAKGMESLANEHLKLSKEPDRAKKEWAEVARRLQHVSQLLKDMRQRYTLTPREVETLLEFLRDRELPEPAGRGKGQKKDKEPEKKPAREGKKEPAKDSTKKKDKPDRPK